MKLSVIIPSYNVMQYIDKCIYSVLNQRSEDVEIIIIDDGSTDGSDLFLKKISKNRENFRVVSQSNQGLSSARNHGLQLATGEYILFLDGDDYLYEGCLDKMLSCLEKNKLDIIMFDYIKMWPSGHFSSVQKISEIKTNCILNVAKDNITSKIYNSSTMYIWKYLIKKDIIIRHKFKVGAKFEDVIFTPKLIDSCTSFFYLPIIGVIYNQRDNSIAHDMSLTNITDRSLSTTYYPKEYKLGNEETCKSHNLFSMKIFTWSIKFLIINNYEDKYKLILQFNENFKNSLFNNVPLDNKRLKKVDKNAYRLYKFCNKPRLIYLISKIYHKNKLCKKVILKYFKILK